MTRIGVSDLSRKTCNAWGGGGDAARPADYGTAAECVKLRETQVQSGRASLRPGSHDHACMPRPFFRSAPGLLLVCALPLCAAEPKPEIERPAASPQAVGVVHTLRTIPEACARIEGQFTGQAAQPYKFALARTNANCQPRARLVDATKAKPSIASGWIFNDLIRVPSAMCPAQQAVVRIWRKPADARPPKLDAQGRSRIYLKDATDRAKAGAPSVPVYAAAMAVEGKSCGG